MNIKLGIISDLHVRKNTWFIQQRLINNIMEFFTKKQVDAVINMGDHLDGDSPIEDEKIMIMVHEELKQYNIKVFYLYGNHDLIYTSKNRLNDILKKNNSYEMVRLKGFLLLFLDSNDGKAAFISKKQINWMCKILSENHSPVLFFSHHPIFAVDVSEHPYFSFHPDEAFVENYYDIQNCILKNPKSLAVFQGHLHQFFKRTISGKFFSINPPLYDSIGADFPEGGIAIANISFPGIFKVSYFQVIDAGDRYTFSEMNNLEFQSEHY
ncbi:MAG: metallophosphoesterase [Atribacterota bacterium]